VPVSERLPSVPPLITASSCPRPVDTVAAFDNCTPRRFKLSAPSVALNLSPPMPLISRLFKWMSVSPAFRSNTTLPVTSLPAMPLTVIESSPSPAFTVRLPSDTTPAVDRPSVLFPSPRSKFAAPLSENGPIGLDKISSLPPFMTVLTDVTLLKLGPPTMVVLLKPTTVMFVPVCMSWMLFESSSPVSVRTPPAKVAFTVPAGVSRVSS
jgi:hypothetical protein